MADNIKQIPGFRLNLDNPLENDVFNLLNGIKNKKQYILNALIKTHNMECIENLTDKFLEIVREEIKRGEEITEPDDLSV